MNTTYDTDFYTWTQQQANLLKTGRFSDADLENIIEEIESMGRSEKRELESRLSVLLLHLLKWQYQPARQCRSWRLSIDEQRIQFIRVLNENPGLKPHFQQILIDAYELAVVKAAKETRLSQKKFPAECPFEWEDLVKTGFYPD
jgi:hypothetical protein